MVLNRCQRDGQSPAVLFRPSRLPERAAGHGDDDVAGGTAPVGPPEPGAAGARSRPGADEHGSTGQDLVDGVDDGRPASAPGMLTSPGRAPSAARSRGGLARCRIAKPMASAVIPMTEAMIAATAGALRERCRAASRVARRRGSGRWRGQPADLADQPRRQRDRAQDDDDGAGGDLELAAGPGAAGQVGRGPAGEQDETDHGPAGPAAHLPATPGQHGGDVGARRLHAPAPAPRSRRRPPPTTRAVASSRQRQSNGPRPTPKCSSDRHADPAERQGRAARRRWPSRAPITAAWASTERRMSRGVLPGRGEQSQVAPPAPDADRERRAGQQHDLDDDRHDHQGQDGLGGRVAGRELALAAVERGAGRRVLDDRAGQDEQAGRVEPLHLGPGDRPVADEQVRRVGRVVAARVVQRAGQAEDAAGPGCDSPTVV